MREIFVQLNSKGNYSLSKEEIKLGVQKRGIINYVLENVPERITDAQAVRNLNQRSSLHVNGFVIKY